MASAATDDDDNDDLNTWLSEKIKELKEPVKPCAAVRELALMLAKKDTVGKREVRIHDDSKVHISWTTKMDRDLVGFALYHANLNSSMRSMEVNIFLFTFLVVVQV